MEKNKSPILPPIYLTVDELTSPRNFPNPQQGGDSGSSLDEKKLNMGVLGRFFGTEKQAERSMVFLLTVLALFLAFILSCFGIAYAKEFTSIGGLLCGYFIGSGRSSS